MLGTREGDSKWTICKESSGSLRHLPSMVNKNILMRVGSVGSSSRSTSRRSPSQRISMIRKYMIYLNLDWEA
jgi:hypothetical protein